MVISSIDGELPAMMDVVAVATPIPAVVPTRIGGKFRKLCSKISLLSVAPTRIRSKFSGFLSGAFRAVSAVMHAIPDIMNSPEIPISAFLSNDIIIGGCWTLTASGPDFSIISTAWSTIVLSVVPNCIVPVPRGPVPNCSTN